MLGEIDEDDETNITDQRKAVSEYYSCTAAGQKVLGEELYYVKKEIRPLYFGLKNIIFQEMRKIDKPVNVKAFFIEEEAAGFPSGASVPSR